MTSTYTQNKYLEEPANGGSLSFFRSASRRWILARALSRRSRAIPKSVTALASKFMTQLLPEDYLIFNAGDSAENFYIIARGEVEVFQTIGGKKKRLNHLFEGDYFGEIALLRSVPRTASVQTKTSVILLVLSRTEFENLVGSNQDLKNSLEASISQYLKIEGEV